MGERSPVLPVFLLYTESAMAIDNIAPTTELQAVNYLLATIGESAVESLEDPIDPDVLMALEELRTSARELMTTPWRFNSEYHLQLSPTVSDFEWTDPNGSTVELAVWEVPEGLASWELSRIPEQLGSKHIDAVEFVSKQYTSGDPAGPALVFYDRDYNRDGFPVSQRQYLWINAVWFRDFRFLPETARRLVTVIASRRLAAHAVGSQTLVGLTERDEALAWKAFLREQSPADRNNVLAHPNMIAALGGRRATIGQPTTWLKNRRL